MASFHEVNWGRKLQKIPPGSCLVFDKGFTDYLWYQDLCDQGIFFVTRMKKNATPTYLKKRPGRKPSNINKDQTIKLSKMNSTLRLIDYTDPETGKKYQFLTNATHLNAQTIADLYRERWQIEQFFRWVKQNLKIKNVLWHFRQCRSNPDLDSALCLPPVIVYKNLKQGLDFPSPRSCDYCA